MPHKLFLTTRQKSKVKNAFANSMSTDIKLSKAQLTKIMQSGRILGAFLGQLIGPLIKVGAPFAKHFFGAIQRKMRDKCVVRAGKRMTERL